MILAYAKIGGRCPDSLEIDRQPYPLPEGGDAESRIRQAISDAGFTVIGELLEALPGSYEAEVQPAAATSKEKQS